MAERKTARKGAPRSAKSASADGKGSRIFTEEERAAAAARVREAKAAASGNAVGESELLASIARMQPLDRARAERLHAIIKASGLGLTPTTWYGMPAYARDGKVICFLQPAQKFKTRYATLGFSDKAKLDEGHMWPNAYALTKLTPTEEARIVALVRKAVS